MASGFADGADKDETMGVGDVVYGVWAHSLKPLFTLVRNNTCSKILRCGCNHNLLFL